MVAEARDHGDVEEAVRQWARDNVLPSSGAGNVNRRVFFGYDKNAAFPQIAAFKISGPDDQCLVQFDVWGGSRAQAARIAAELQTAAEKLSRYESGNVLLKGAEVFEGSLWQPDEESKRPRYVVQITFSAWATGPTPSTLS